MEDYRVQIVNVKINVFFLSTSKHLLLYHIAGKLKSNHSSNTHIIYTILIRLENLWYDVFLGPIQGIILSKEYCFLPFYELAISNLQKQLGQYFAMPHIHINIVIYTN